MKTSWFYGVGLLLLLCMSSQAAFTASQPLDYDVNGNLISGKGKYYEYNDANKLVRVREGSKEGPVIAQYWYDYKGQRVKKVENGITTYYIGKQYEERNGPSTNEKTNFYFAGGQRVARKTQKDNKPSETFYYLNNHLGSVEAVTSASGAVVDRLEYFPYGSIRNTGSERYSYTGKEKDMGTGQYYYEARYYDALVHHFTQADTVTPNVYDPQSLNKFIYVNNNPLKYIDPSGHLKINWDALSINMFAKLGGVGGSGAKEGLEMLGNFGKTATKSAKGEWVGAMYGMHKDIIKFAAGTFSKGAKATTKTIFGAIDFGVEVSKDMKSRGYSYSDVKDAFVPKNIIETGKFVVKNPNSLIDAGIETSTVATAAAINVAADTYSDGSVDAECSGAKVQESVENSIAVDQLSDAIYNTFYSPSAPFGGGGGNSW